MRLHVGQRLRQRPVQRHEVKDGKNLNFVEHRPPAALSGARVDAEARQRSLQTGVQVPLAMFPELPQVANDKEASQRMRRVRIFPVKTSDDLYSRSRQAGGRGSSRPEPVVQISHRERLLQIEAAQGTVGSEHSPAVTERR